MPLQANMLRILGIISLCFVLFLIFILSHPEPINLFASSAPIRESKPLGVILYVKNAVGIGNQLFLYACHYALAKDFNTTLYMSRPRSLSNRKFKSDKREFALDQFQIPFTNLIDTTTGISNKSNVTALEDLEFLEWKNSHRNDNNQSQDLITLSSHCYCQSREFWTSYQEELKALLTPRYQAIRHDLDSLENMKNQILQSSESVAVHVRIYESNSFFIPMSFYRLGIRKAVEILLKRGKEAPAFFIFSDDISHAQTKLSDLTSKYKLIFVSGKGFSSIEEFYLMTRCKHFIISTSTFGWWAAFLGGSKDKIVIASTHNPRFGPLQNKFGFERTLLGTLYHPKEWIVLNYYTGGLSVNKSESF